MLDAVRCQERPLGCRVAPHPVGHPAAAHPRSEHDAAADSCSVKVMPARGGGLPLVEPGSDELDDRHGRQTSLMATRTETVTYHSCDLCGQDYDEADLTRLYGAQQAGGQRPQIDICQSCHARPVAEVVEWLRSKQTATTPRPLRGVRGGR